MQPNYKQSLRDLYKKSCSSTAFTLSNSIKDNVEIIAQAAFTQKAVFTVLVTLLFYKIHHPQQDIRYHKVELDNGFSGRTFDTKFVTPVLKELKLPSMAESGWLTRSLEQAHPYTMDYKGKINNPQVKNAFLTILDQVETHSLDAKNILLYLLSKVHQQVISNYVSITPLQNAEKLSIQNIITLLSKQFSQKYGTFGGAKLPVLAFYALYQILITEIKRYEKCHLTPLAYATTSDLTAKSAGDIEIYQQEQLIEVLEIKLDKEIDANMVRIAYEKIARFNPNRYYILSSYGIKKSDEAEVNQLVDHIKAEHGCHLILNGLLPTIKYYLRLISSLSLFIEKYSQLIEDDTELKKQHKLYWNELLATL